jgi:hypothetical protein
MVLDSGASHHMLNNSAMFVNISLTAIPIATGNKGKQEELERPSSDLATGKP